MSSKKKGKRRRPKSPTKVHPSSTLERRLEISAERFEGPLPHPATLEEYDRIVPGSAELIVQQFELQGAHRRKQESRIVGRGTLGELIGVFSSFFIAVLTIGGGLWLIYSDKDAEGLTAILGALTGLVTIYRTGKRSQ